MLIIVDAYAAQHADEKSKPITVAFALIGLYLQIEKHYSGKEVQRAHMRLAKKKRQWPVFDFPAHRGNIALKLIPIGMKLDGSSGLSKYLIIHHFCCFFKTSITSST